jgi:hypothetical protein
MERSPLILDPSGAEQAVSRFPCETLGLSRSRALCLLPTGTGLDLGEARPIFKRATLCYRKVMPGPEHSEKGCRSGFSAEFPASHFHEQ